MSFHKKKYHFIVYKNHTNFFYILLLKKSKFVIMSTKNLEKLNFYFVDVFGK